MRPAKAAGTGKTSWKRRCLILRSKERVGLVVGPATLLKSANICRRKWQPTPVFMPEKSQGSRSLGGLQSLGSQRATSAQLALASPSQVGEVGLVSEETK